VLILFHRPELFQQRLQGFSGMLVGRTNHGLDFGPAIHHQLIEAVGKLRMIGGKETLIASLGKNVIDDLVISLGLERHAGSIDLSIGGLVSA
jgi:hypothetical protein